MAEAMHPLAPHYLPGFITAPGETDPFLTGVAIFLVVMVVLIGSLYFRLHAFPEQMAHRGASHQQFQLVAVLSLLALFTHNGVFWVAALLLAFVPIPDFWSPLAQMAESLGRMANRRSRSKVEDAIVDGRSQDELEAETIAPQTQVLADHPTPDQVTPSRPLFVAAGTAEKPSGAADKIDVAGPNNPAYSHPPSLSGRR